MKTLLASLLLSLGITLFAAESNTLTVGKTEITISPDSTPRTVPLSLFSGATEAEMKAIASLDTVNLDRNVFLLEIDEQLVLVDTGDSDGRGFLKYCLGKKQHPFAVKAILITHMHQDHIGKLIQTAHYSGSTGGGSMQESLFLFAKIYISKPEIEYWSRPEHTNSLAAKVLKICADQIVPFDFDTEILPGVWARNAVGHTPGHTVFETADVLFVGDLLHSAALQFANPDICANFDMDKDAAVIARKAWLTKVTESNIAIAGAHFPFPGIGKVKAEGDGFVFEKF